LLAFIVPAPATKTSVAVKIIDMLGEEVLETAERQVAVGRERPTRGLSC
jgi:hypothetical protein